MPAGRPTDYDPKYIDEVLAYFSQEPFTVENGKRVPIELPTKAGFCAKIGIHRDTLHQWTKTHPEFSDSLSKGMEHQDRILMANTLLGSYNPVIAKLIAINNLGYREKQEIDHTTKGDKIEGAVRTPAVMAAEMKAAKVYEEEMRGTLLD